MGTDSDKLGGFEQAQLLEIIAAACDGAELAVVITMSETDPPQNLFLNPGAERLLGYSVAQFRSMSAWDWLAPEELPRVATLRERYMRGEELPKPFETTVLNGAGERIDVEVLQSRAAANGRALNVAFLFDRSAHAGCREPRSRARRSHHGLFAPRGCKARCRTNRATIPHRYAPPGPGGIPLAL